MADTLSLRAQSHLASDAARLADLATADETTRVRLAAASTTGEALLHLLARDQAIAVRATVAMNPAASASVDRALIGDPDERVRLLLGRKLAEMMPCLSYQKRDALQEQALAALLTLVADEAVRVRAAIADVLKEMPDAPRDIVLRLAHDTALEVAEPIIRLSPLLGTEDLLAVLAAGPSSATAIAVARRPYLCEDVTDVLANTSSSEAISALLSNTSACIRESTLDALVARAAAETSWHEPLLLRPQLSHRATLALSQIVTGTLLSVLARRTNLDPTLAKELQRRIEGRLSPQKRGTDRPPTIDEAMDCARVLASQGQLNEDTILASARRGEARMCTALLAVAADVPGSVVDRVCTLRSAKGLVSLIWKAGFTMRIAGPLQTLMVRLPPSQLLRAQEGEKFPLAPDEMYWQIELLTRAAQ
jgi:uncharacterized protein (DUF2336 family)